MPFVIHANLDCEARWAGRALPAQVAARVSYYAALLSALAPAGEDVEVWAPAPIDASRLVASPRWRPPAMRAGTPPRADLAWADDAAKPVNDHRLALAIATELGIALPGAREITEADPVVAGRWVAKAPWTTAGRDRCHGEGAPTVEQRTRLARLLDRFGALVVEPWADRLFDVGVCARGDVVQPPHGLVTDARGTFLGIEVAPPPLTDAERETLATTARAVSARLAERGYTGPFAIDGFVYRDARGERRLHPLCEINARYTFGWVARALGGTLGFCAAPPPGATTLIAPANDGITASVIFAAGAKDTHPNPSGP